jgi:hypothetical protein
MAALSNKPYNAHLDPCNSNAMPYGPTRYLNGQVYVLGG